MKANILSFVIALAVTGVLTPLAIVIAPKIGAMDIPKDERRMHKKPIPRFGGLGIYIVKQMASDVRYEYTDGHNVLTVVFAR